ncbi:helix-turn-helix domain-containing protein [Mucilaginibacter ginkgonis]|uniref:Helix-turn-helix domain-containing protein n=1 Tax=Mucilaginibacter ginkgonis TaxID=2682091 RepID=A0A6I4HUP6_9SPHI|nr:helix-turn-helix domain-containing protein [Mucilaginibacter ginkgonis]QQL50173.1 helix-turn-helix domain-containing protein [Mucilaginibacter ginkgonis]
MEKALQRFPEQGKIFRDQLITVGDLLDFKNQLLGDIKLLITDQLSRKGKKWIKAIEVRKLLNISSGKLQYLRDNGKIPYTKLGQVTYYDADKIETLMETETIIKP